MTELLEKAFQEAANLPQQEQDALANWKLQELQSERHWSTMFAASEDELSALADEALAEYRRRLKSSSIRTKVS